MKIKIIGAITGAMIFSAGANAGTLIDVYTGATLGMGGATAFTDGKTSNQSALSYGGVLGIDIPLLRIEAEYNYMTMNDNNMQLGMLNGYFKIPMIVVKPYVGAGVGTIFGGTFNNTDIETRAAYQAMLGLTFDIPLLPIKFDIEARGLYAPNFYTAKYDIKPDLLHYDLRAKMRYVF